MFLTIVMLMQRIRSGYIGVRLDGQYHQIPQTKMSIQRASRKIR
jgi:hypothetical protein